MADLASNVLLLYIRNELFIYIQISWKDTGEVWSRISKNMGDIGTWQRHSFKISGKSGARFLAYLFLKKLSARPLKCLMTYAVGQLCVTKLIILGIYTCCQQMKVKVICRKFECRNSRPSCRQRLLQLSDRALVQ